MWQKRLKDILSGIDACESDTKDGWWATSVGSDFGSKKLEAVTQLIEELEGQRIRNIGDVRTGNVLIVQHSLPVSGWHRKQYYETLRTYFAQRNIYPRILSFGPNTDLVKVSMDEMATYGWVRKK